MNTQMNVRIDEQVKLLGDEVFAGLGFTPSQVVRRVWEFAAAHREAPDIVLAALGGTCAGSDMREELLHASSACERFREQFGLPAPDRLEEIDYRALREEAYYERMAERGIA